MPKARSSRRRVEGGRDPALGHQGADAPPRGAEPISVAMVAAMKFRYLVLVLLLGLALRLVGIGWGLPGPQHAHSYHPDEILLAAAAARVEPLAGKLDAGFYNYGSLTIFVVRLTFDAVSLLAPPGAEEWAVLARLHLVGRLLTALFGAATLVLVYAMGRRVGGETGGLAAAAALAIAPAHVAHSHFLTVDVPAAFFATAAASAALCLLEGPRLRTALLAGACAGLAAATKYNAGLALLAPLAAIALRSRPPRAVILLGAACVGAAAAAFLAGCPGVLLNTPTFLKHFLYEARHVQTGHGLLFERTLPGWLYHVVTSLRFGLGMPLLLVVLAGCVRAARRRSAADLVLAAWVVPYYLLIGAAQVKFLRYTIPLLPILAVWAGALCGGCFAGARRSLRGALAALVLVGVSFWTLGGAVVYDLFFALPDPRDRAASLVQGLLPRGASVGLTSVPWFYTPPIVPWNGGAWTRQTFEEAMRRDPPFLVLPGPWTAERLARERPDCFVVSDLEIRDGLRLGLPGTRRLLRALDRHYRRRVVSPLAYWPGLLGPGYPPEDWLYPAPTLFVYLRR